MLSWGHDEVRWIAAIFLAAHNLKVPYQYLYHVLKEQSSLPEEGLAMIRYHSFYPYVFLCQLASPSQSLTLHQMQVAP